MKVVRHHAVAEDQHLELSCPFRKQLDKRNVIKVLAEDDPAVVSAIHDVVGQSWGSKPVLSRHSGVLLGMV
jgi:hypothetical protein